MRLAGHAVLVLVLTALTELGGLAWLVAFGLRRRLLAFGLAYLALWGAAFGLAPLGGRVALPCFAEPLRM